MNNAEKRAMTFLVGLLILLAAVFGRLVVLQVRDHETYRQIALRQHRRMTDVEPWRGDIYFREQDRSVLMAGSVGRHSILVHGKVKEPEPLIAGLDEILRLSPEERAELRRKLEHGRAFWFKRRGIEHGEAAALGKALKTLDKFIAPGAKRPHYRAKLSDIELFEEPVRIYPFGSQGSHILGLVDIEGVGRAGVEATFQGQLEGLAGLREFEVDNRRRQLAELNSVSVPDLPGYALVLTIDRRIQGFVEEALDEATTHWKPAGISVVAVEPATGRILALACRPTFDPGETAKTPMEHLRNRAITDPYEPGSTIKALLVSRVWELGRGDPEAPIALPRTLRVPGRRKPIEDSHQVAVEGRGTKQHDVIEQSSNVGSYLLSSLLSDAELRETLRLFGLGQETGIALPGETSGNLKLASNLNTGNRAALAQGYGLLVTPLQMVMAYAAIANGGTLYRPRLAYELRDAENHVQRTFEPLPLARILGAKVSREWMSEALASVVEGKHGTARRARIPGYRMGGKTGTSKKLVTEGSDKRAWHYSPTRTVCSFIGFAPVEDPRICIAVVVDDPTLEHGRTFGGVVAAPIASEIVGRALKYLGVPPVEPKEEEPKPGRRT